MVTSMEVVRHAMRGIDGLTITSTYRDPAKNRSVGGSDTSWHLNESNPAVDVAGPASAMRELADRLGSYGYDAELLYETEGHNDHVHFALRSTNVAPPEEAAGSVSASSTGSSGGGMDIEAIQKKLKELGYDPGPIDGINGPLTKAAVKKFQKDSGLVEDGIVGPKTSEALGLTVTDGEGDEDGDDERTFREIIEEEYPSLVWAIDHPELGPLIEEAEANGWTPLKLKNEVEGTDWWQNTSATRRGLEILKQTDPASYRQRVTEAHRQVKTLAQDLGVEITQEQVADIGRQLLFTNLDQRQLTQAIVGRSNISDEDLVTSVDEGSSGGAVSQVGRRIEQISNDYLLELDDQTRAEWIRKIVMGEQTEASFEQYAQKMAVTQMPFLSDFIDQGLSPQEGLQPYRQTFARLLEINPAEVNWRDPKYQRAIRVQDGDTTRLATTSELSARVIEEFHDQWDRTNGAKQQAVDLTGQIADMFGRRA